MTSWMWASRGVVTASATTRDGLGPQEPGGVVIAALVVDQFALHRSIDAAGEHRRDPERGLVGAQ